MDNKKTMKTNLPPLFLIIAIIVILVIGYFLYKLNSENTTIKSNESNLNAKITELEGKLASKNGSNNNTNDSQTSQKSFSEIMDILYTKSGTKLEETNLTSTPSDDTFMLNTDRSNNVIDVEYTNVSVIDNEVNFNMHKINPKQDISTSITGINEEIVSITIYPVEGGANPSFVFFLTRNGNVYYIDEAMISSNNFSAKQLINLKEIIKLEIVDATSPEAMHSTRTVIATTYSGEKIDVFNQIYIDM